MKKNIFIELDKNVAGAVIARIYHDGVELLAASHPGTIAAALFALGVSGFMFHQGAGIAEVSAIDVSGTQCCLLPIADDRVGEKFVDAILMFHNLSFKAGVPNDGIADIHFRTAVHHLPMASVRNHPTTPPPAGFKAALRERNKYVYFPDC